MLVICSARGIALTSVIIFSMCAASCMLEQIKLRRELPELYKFNLIIEHIIFKFYL